MRGGHGRNGSSFLAIIKPSHKGGETHRSVSKRHDNSYQNQNAIVTAATPNERPAQGSLKPLSINIVLNHAENFQ